MISRFLFLLTALFVAVQFVPVERENPPVAPAVRPGAPVGAEREEAYRLAGRCRSRTRLHTEAMRRESVRTRETEAG